MKPRMAGVKLTLILSYKGIEIFVTMVMAIGVLISTPLPEPTYSQAVEPVNMASDKVESQSLDSSLELIASIIQTNTAGTTQEAKPVRRTVVGSPRLVAQPGESQEVIDAIINTFPEEPVMVEVARCESQLDPTADRRGIDGGLFQINQIHLPTLAEMGLDRYNLQDNLTYSRILYDQSGLQPWSMSEYCWEKWLG